MPKIVLLVEDNPEEQAAAKAILTTHGFRIVTTDTLKDALRIMQQLEGKLDGIVTDLHIPESSEPYEAARNVSQPRGLAIVAEAARRGLPVVVCSDIDHHRVDYLKIVIEAFGRYYPFSHLPFIMDMKDWERAVHELRSLLAENEEGI